MIEKENRGNVRKMIEVKKGVRIDNIKGKIIIIILKIILNSFSFLCTYIFFS